MPSQKPKVSIAVPHDHNRNDSGAEGLGAGSASETEPLNNKQVSPGGVNNGSLSGIVRGNSSFGGDRTTDSLAGSPFAPRVTNGRRSFAATLWNPMSDDEKRQFNRRRFLQLTVGIFMGVMVGVQYAFGVVSNNLKTRAGFRQSDMTTITTVGNVLFAFTFPAGVIFDYAGPTPVLICAMIFGCTGFTLLALIFGGVIEPTVATVAIANGLPNWQAGFLESGTLLPSLFMFPTNKGEVVILQKTFFGLGSTFLSLSFDGFFSQRDDYMGYCIYVASLIFIAITAGTLVTRLPAYKRTTRELDAIAKMSPMDAERAKTMEEQSFEMHHNPRLSDRRRLNYGVFVLLVTLVFFTSLSFTKAFVSIPTGAILVLTFIALFCIASFGLMLYPKELPEFFDFEFLPDIHPPEELVDKPEPKSNKKNGSLSGPLNNVVVDAGVGGVANASATDSMAEDPRAGTTASMGSNAKKKTVKMSPAYDNTDDGYGEGSSPYGRGSQGAGSPSMADGRASQFLAHRRSVAGGSMIAIPKAVSPMAIPSITTHFLQSLRHPFIWCFWFTAFCIMGTNFVFVNNITQIYVALNDGTLVKSANSLNVALIGIGSAIGRISAGFGETLLHRMNAMRRDEQLEYMAKQELGVLTSDDHVPDMTPVYHRWNASIVMVLPFSPLVVSLMCLTTLFMPPAALGVVLIVFATFVGLFLALLALSVREIFSVDVAKHLNFILSAGMVATVLLNRLMFGMWYDQEFDRQQAENKSGNDLASIAADQYNDHQYNNNNGDISFFNGIGQKADSASFALFANESTTTTAEEDDSTTTTVTPDTTIPSVETTTEMPTEDDQTTSSDDNSNTTTAPTTPAPAAKQQECAGVACVQKSMLVLAGINVGAVFSASYVVYHWWQVRKTF